MPPGARESAEGPRGAVRNGTGTTDESQAGRRDGTRAVALRRAGDRRAGAMTRAGGECAARPSEWISAHLFFDGGTYSTLSDDVILDVVKPFLASYSSVQWFFVRYDEEGPHVRLRVKGPPEWLGDIVAPALRQ